MLSNFFTDLATGVSSFVTTLVDLIIKLFTGLFCEVDATTHAITGLSPVAEIAIAFLAIYMCYKFLPTVLGWFKLKSKTGRKKRAKAK